MENYRMRLGAWGEQIAVSYLVRSGYIILDRRWHKQVGEIDIIAYEKEFNCLVFVEVKTRTSNTFGVPELAIDNRKKEKLKDVIDLYIAENKVKSDYRFDVIIVRKREKTIINHLKNVVLEY